MFRSNGARVAQMLRSNGTRIGRMIRSNGTRIARMIRPAERVSFREILLPSRRRFVRSAQFVSRENTREIRVIRVPSRRSAKSA
jgi:hypothetical protein